MTDHRCIHPVEGSDERPRAECGGDAPYLAMQGEREWRVCLEHARGHRREGLSVRYSTSGSNLAESDRGTDRLQLRLAPEAAAHLRGLAEVWGVTLSETVTELLRRVGYVDDED
jgi:hypothetical protein